MRENNITHSSLRIISTGSTINDLPDDILSLIFFSLLINNIRNVRSILAVSKQFKYLLDKNYMSISAFEDAVDKCNRGKKDYKSNLIIHMHLIRSLLVINCVNLEKSDDLFYKVNSLDGVRKFKNLVNYLNSIHKLPNEFGLEFLRRITNSMIKVFYFSKFDYINDLLNKVKLYISLEIENGLSSNEYHGIISSNLGIASIAGHLLMMEYFVKLCKEHDIGKRNIILNYAKQLAAKYKITISYDFMDGKSEELIDLAKNLIHSGFIDRLTNLLKKNPWILYVDMDDSLLTVAYNAKKLDVIEKLTSLGADLNRFFSKKFIDGAFIGSDINIFNLLLKDKSINLVPESYVVKQIAIASIYNANIASDNNSLEVLKYLLDNKLIFFNTILDEDGNRILHLAIKSNSIYAYALKYILKYITNNKIHQNYFNVKNYNGDTLLHLAASNRNVRMTSIIYRLFPENINMKNLNNEIPLMVSIRKFNYGVIRILSEFMNISIEDKNNGNIKGLYNYYDYLISCIKNSIDFNTIKDQSMRRKYILSLKNLIALFGNNAICVNSILQLNLNTSRHQDLYCVLEYIIKSYVNKTVPYTGNISEIKKNIENYEGNYLHYIGALRLSDSNGITLLHLMAKNPLFSQYMEVFLENMPLDVNVKDKNGMTPLHYAVAAGSTESVYHLVNFGADPNIKDGNNRKPIDIVESRSTIYLFLNDLASTDSIKSVAQSYKKRSHELMK